MDILQVLLRAFPRVATYWIFSTEALAPPWQPIMVPSI